MKKILNHTLAILLVIFGAVSLCSCGDDDDDDIVLESYIIGKWHSYKYVFHMNGESKTMDISKTGPYSSIYFEYDFKSDNTMIGGYWEQDEFHASHWVHGNCIYSVRGNEVRTKDSGGTIMDLTFNPNDRTLYIRSSQNIQGDQVTSYIYFKKFDN